MSARTSTAVKPRSRSTRPRSAPQRKKLTGVWPYDNFAEFMALGGQALDAEYRFAAPARQWRFDFAHLPSRVAIELDGGTWAGGRHTRGAGFARDCEKFNVAAQLGWRVFRLTPQMLQADPERWREAIIDAIADVAK